MPFSRTISSKLKENPEEFSKDGMKERYSLHQHTSIHAIQMLMLERLLCLKRNVELLHGVTAYFGTVKESGKYHTIAVNQDSLITDQCVQFFQLMSLFLMEE